MSTDPSKARGDQAQDAGTAEVRVDDEPGRARYEIHVGDDLAGFAEYRLGEHHITFFHTEIESGYEGRGLGTRLAREALDAVHSRGLRVIPVCPFIAAYLRDHPEDFPGLEISWPASEQPRGLR